MLNFRQDKVGFFSGLTLLTLLGLIVIAPLVIVMIGGWEKYNGTIKIIWGTAWVLMILTVLLRVGIYRFQMIKGNAPNKLPEIDSKKASRENDKTGAAH